MILPRDSQPEGATIGMRGTRALFLSVSHSSGFSRDPQILRPGDRTCLQQATTMSLS